MAAIAGTNMRAAGGAAKAVTLQTLTASDTLTFDPLKRPVLILENRTGGAIAGTVIDGDAAAAVAIPDAGSSFTTSGGFAVGSIAAGAAVAIELASISAYLKGTIAVTGGTGLTAILLQF